MGVFVVAEKGWFWRKQGSVFGPVTEEVLRSNLGRRGHPRHARAA